MRRPARRMCSVAAALAAAALAGLCAAASAQASFGIERFENVLSATQAEAPATQAGSHPYSMRTTIVFNHHGEGEELVPDGDPKDVEVNLPPGVVVNPTASAQRCTEAELENRNGCPDATAVGIVTLNLTQFPDAKAAVYDMVPQKGVPAELGFTVIGIVVHLTGNARTGGDYGLSAFTADILQRASAVNAVTLTLWGNPSDASHDPERGLCAGRNAEAKQEEREEFEQELKEKGKSEREFGFDCPVPRLPTPLLSMPSACPGEPLRTTMRADSWQRPGVFATASATSAATTGCGALPFTPTFTAQPDSADAESPTGLGVTLAVPQEESLKGLATSDLKEAVVRLPAGMAVSPAAANGLGACTLEQVALTGPGPASCPDSAKIATAVVETPLLSAPLEGGVYLAQQGNLAGNGSNPFGSLLALYLVAEGSGAIVKLAGEATLDPVAGQIGVRFGEDPLRTLAVGRPQFLPELPFTAVKLHFFGGPRAALVTPSACGSYTTTSRLVPWGGAPVAEPASSFAITGACAEAPLAPSFVAGTTSNQAGASSPFQVVLRRNDRERRFGSVQVTTPPGLLGVLASVTPCAAAQAASGTCGPDSLIGTTSVTAGPGPSPLPVGGGRVYLTGPYKGSPFGLSIVVPAVAGPFNLGDVVVRAQIGVDRTTARITVTSDPLPTILQGVPLDVRTILVDIDRPGFMVNPTDCAALASDARIAATDGSAATVTSPFRAANCSRLPFAPRFAMGTVARTSRLDGTSLRVHVTSRPGEANIAKVRVELPRQLPTRLTTLQKACPDTVFDRNPAACPPASQVGVAAAGTPLLAHRLIGPAYLVSHGGAAFPDLTIVLQGEGLTLVLDGTTDIKHGITSSSFETVPDAPISSFELSLPAGPFSVLGANLPVKEHGSMCRQRLLAPTRITGQNGDVVKLATAVAVSGCPRVRGARRRARSSWQRRAR